MKFSFEARICKIGINPCVAVPAAITEKLQAVRGYIMVRGKIGTHSFQQTLVPIKDAEYRLYVNGPMLKGANVAVGDRVTFIIEPDPSPRTLESYPFPKEFKTALLKHKLMPAFRKLTASRQKEVLKYLGFLKTKESLQRNIDKVISGLQKT